jgi:hypothetical protein
MVLKLRKADKNYLESFEMWFWRWMEKIGWRGRVRNEGFFKFYFVRTVHFGMKLYNDQRNTQVYNLFICLLLSYMFWAFF